MTDQDEPKLTSYGTPTRARFVVLTLLCLVAAVAYISRNAISVPAKLIQEELDITQTQMGWVMSAFSGATRCHRFRVAGLPMCGARDDR